MDDKNGATDGIENLPKVNPPEVKRSWGDEVDDDEPESALSGSGDKAEELNVSSLAIDENKNVNRFLDDPDDSNIRAALYVDMNFERPSKIQAISLPMILTPPHKDLIAQAHNGSGKTTCFVLGMLSRVDPTLKARQALCICPTRELAIQNLEVLQKMGKYIGITSECAVPMDSTNYIPITKRAPITAQIVIGTPGTIKKWMSAKKLSTRDMKILIFDEADRMLAEDGFKDDSLRIMKDIERNSAHCQELYSTCCVMTWA